VNDNRNSNWLDERARQTMAENGFEPNFPADAQAQLQTIEQSHDSPTIDSDVQDLRSLLWSSIDNESSRDLDQIECAEQLENGDIRILVGIADVDHLVAKDTPLDRHAA